MSQTAPDTQAPAKTRPDSSGLAPGSLTLRQAADALSTSTTSLRKMIRQGRLPEAEKVRTEGGRVWSIPAESIPAIAERTGTTVSVIDTIDLREPELPESEGVEATPEIEEVLMDPAQMAEGVGSNTIYLDSRRHDAWRYEPTPSERPETAVQEAVADETVATETVATETVARVESPVDESPVAPVQVEASTALESIGAEADVDDAGTGAPTLAEVMDTALLEKLLGAKEAETVALVKAERQRTEYEALAARQLDVERRYADADLQRTELTERLQSESLARAISDARVTELRDQLQREITYAEAERYERRQALARETKSAVEAAEVRSALGWWGRRKLRRVD